MKNFTHLKATVINRFALHISWEQGCSGAGMRGNGVPTPFSRFAFKWVWSYLKWLDFGCVPTPFLSALRPW